jgi:exodeoxyribonuclease V gamma subunit
MPLSIRFDNRLDRLADALIARLAEPAPADPLARHPVIVPSLGVGRWLQQRVAIGTGVCARLDPDLPGRLLWAWLRELLPGLPARSPFEPEVVRWRLLALFDELPAGVPDLAALRERVHGAPARQRLAVATEVASLFDRYLAWRRDWLECWQRGDWAGGRAGALGPHEGWQRWLWLRLLESMPGLADRHPYERLEAEVLARPGEVAAVLGARRVSVFGMPAMSPTQFGLFGLLGQVADVAFFVPDPCREWWADLVDSRHRARVLAERPDQAWLYDGEPAVLGDWGRGQRDFVAQVAELQERFGVQASEPFRELDDPDGLPQPPDCLRAMRQAVFLRSDSPWEAVAGPDDSIVVHAAHGPIRQAEVLHDLLLDCFERLPGLRPSEVAVFCADIGSAAPAIEAVFATADPRRRIPFTISGRPPDTDPLLHAARSLLDLAGPGPTLPAVESWLLNPAVAEVAGLSADDVAALVRLLDEAGARWGLDSADGALKHDWQGALDRLLIGAAVADEVSLVGGLAPVPGLRGSRALLTAPVLALLDVLRELRKLASRPRPVADWCATFARIVESLFGASRRHAESLARLRETLAGLAESAFEAAGEGENERADATPAIDAEAFAFALDEALQASAPAAVASGAVSVCPLGALRGVPFRVICLVGMDAGVFPRAGRRTEADLMRRAPRFGDRFPRSDERGMFLDAVLAAQDRLAILFRGRDARDDEVLDPSPVVLELMAWLRARLDRWLPEGAPLRKPMPARPDAAAIVEHPLHPFSPRAFDPAGTGSHAGEWLPAARALAAPLAGRMAVAEAVAARAASATQPATSQPAVADAPSVISQPAVLAPALFAPPGSELPLGELRAALADPIAWWLRQRAGVSLPRISPQAEEREPLWPGDTDDRQLLDRTARALLDGADPERIEAGLRAAPRLAGGTVGERQAAVLVEQALQLLARAGGARAPVTADLGVELAGGCRLVASLALPGADGRCRRVSGFPLGLHGLVDAWLSHALLAAAAGGAVPAETVLVAPDATAVLRIADPMAALGRALAVAEVVAAGPPPAFPRAWFAAWRGLGQRGPLADGLAADPERGRRALATLHGRIEGNKRSQGERGRPWQAVFWRDGMPDLQSVVEAGDVLWAPILADVEIEVVR